MDLAYPLADDYELPEPSAEMVRLMVDEWLKRLDDLCASIRNWAAANGWTVVDDTPIPMREERV